MKTGNKGFTLVELIVSVAILAIVMLAAFGFMLAGTKSYTSIDTHITRQFKAQLAVNQLGDSLMNCNAGLNTSDDGKTVYILERKDGACTVHAFKLADSEVRYGEAAATENTQTRTENDVPITTTTYTASISNWSRVAGSVDVFSVVLTPDAGAVKSAVISLRFKNSDKTYTQTVALRNTPPVVMIAES